MPRWYSARSFALFFCSSCVWRDDGGRLGAGLAARRTFLAIWFTDLLLDTLCKREIMETEYLIHPYYRLYTLIYQIHTWVYDPVRLFCPPPFINFSDFSRDYTEVHKYIIDSWCFVSVTKQLRNIIEIPMLNEVNPRRHKVKKVTRRHKGGGGQSDPSPLLLTLFIRLTRYLAHIMSILCTFN